MLALTKVADRATTSDPLDAKTGSTQPIGAVVRMRPVEANPAPKATASDVLPGQSHYLLGDDPRSWHTNIPTYAKVEYHDVYPGINLIYRGHQGQLEYDFVVAPGADPAAIRLAFDGVTKLSLDDRGNLLLHTTNGDVVQRAPVIYQEVDGLRAMVSGRYVLHGSREVGFEVGPYDREKHLVIDPVIVYATYLGAHNAFDAAYGIAVDPTGAAYVTGFAGSTEFPTTPGSYQVVGRGFVAKFTPAGDALAYSALVEHQGLDIALDSDGNALVAGRTWTHRGVVMKLNATGSALLYTRELGIEARGVAVDGGGNAYAVGYTQGGLPVTPGAFQTTYCPGRASFYDGFVAKLDPAGAIRYASYLGGCTDDYANGIAVDDSGAAYVAGFTFSSDFPVTNRVFQRRKSSGWDSFVAKVNPDGSELVYSTFLGGNERDHAEGIAIDGAGAAYVAGWTLSTNFPTTQGAFQTQPTSGGGYEAFVTKLGPSGDSLVYSTYFGAGEGALGNGANEQGHGIAVDAEGNAIITGRTNSENLPVVDAPQASYADGLWDAFVAKLNATGSALIYSTYLGGSLTDEGWDVAADSQGSAYVAGLTSSYDFPTVNPVQSTNAGGLQHHDDAFVVKIGEATGPTPRTDLAVTLADAPDPVASGGDLTYTAAVRNDGPDAATKVWIRVRLDPSVEFVSVSASQGACTGPIDVRELVCDLGTLASGSSATVNVDVVAPSVNSGSIGSDVFVTGDQADPNPNNNNTRQVTSIGGSSANTPTPAPTSTPSATPTSEATATPTTVATATPTSLATATPTPSAATDRVTITRAEYRSDKDELRIEATSTNSSATLRAYVTSSGALIGTLNDEGGGDYRGEFDWPSNPQEVTVTSSLGGSATAEVDANN